MSCWVPGHMRITDNERVVHVAKYGSHHPNINPKLLPTRSDLAHLISFHFSTIHHAWATQWQDLHSTNKLATLKKTPNHWHSSNQTSRKTEIILPCLRIEYTRLLHTHLFTDLIYFAYILASTFFFEWAELTNLRNPSSHFITIFDKSLSIQNVLDYLYHTNLFHSPWFHRRADGPPVVSS